MTGKMAPAKEMSIETMERVVKHIQEDNPLGMCRETLCVPSKFSLKFDANIK